MFHKHLFYKVGVKIKSISRSFFSELGAVGRGTTAGKRRKGIKKTVPTTLWKRQPRPFKFQKQKQYNRGYRLWGSHLKTSPT